MSIRSFKRAVGPVVSKRKQRYENDETYRTNAKNASRKSYRKKAGVELDNCLHSLGFLDNVAESDKVRLPNGRETDYPVISVPRTSDLLQTLYQTVWRWINQGIIPKPILVTARDDNRPRAVYHIDEVRILVEEIGAHQRQSKYLRKDHTEVIEAIERRINELRVTLVTQGTTYADQVSTRQARRSQTGRSKTRPVEANPGNDG